ncbi:MAG TPA: hypothetical protein VF595_15170 [Tepidisphaeraceae bacterium]
MGGEQIPDSFVAADPEAWSHFAKIVHEDEYYRFAAVYWGGPQTLTIRDGNDRREITVNDANLDAFRIMKSVSVSQALIVDRALKECWIDIRDIADDFIDYRVELEDYPDA